MMRNLKWRGIRKVDKSWITGTLVHVGGYVGISEHKHCWEEVDKNTLCQFCGCSDRDKFPIFEGDYIRGKLSTAGGSHLWHVEWMVCGFCAIQQDPNDSVPPAVEPVSRLMDVEIVGNDVNHFVDADGRLLSFHEKT